MDLFPKDYKRNDLVSPAVEPGVGATSFLKNLKNKFFAGFGQAKLGFGNGNFSLPSKTKETFLRMGVIISGAALVVVLLLWAGLFFYQKSLFGQINDLKKQQSEIFSAEDKAMAAKIVDFNKGATLAQQLLKNHIYSSAIFSQLAAATLPRVQWRSFDLAVNDNSAALKGLAADYATLAKQILALNEAGFSNIKISNILLDKIGGVGFAAAFNFDPKILLK
ncbi:hypothetical protein KJ590_01535 [Patescibacteria group bacterium]|nr:hypothetical protein [Patescibacteria group bacterium]